MNYINYKPVKRLVTATVLTVLSSLAGFAEELYPVAAIPTVLRQRAGAVVRDHNVTYQIQGPDNVVFTEKKVVTVLNQNGMDEARMEVYYDKQVQIKSLKAAIYNEFGQLTSKVPLSAFQDVSATGEANMYTESRCRYLRPAINTFPFTIVYEAELRQKQTMSFRRWAPVSSESVSLERSTFVVSAPESFPIRYKSQNIQGEPQHSVAGGRYTYTWACSNIQAFRSEMFSPDWIKVLPWVLIAPQHFEYGAYKGGFANWKEYGKWMYDVLLAGRQELPEATVYLVRSITDSLPDEHAKAKALYEYMQKKCRYISVQVGIGGLRPSPAEEVDRLSYGDCKGLVNYMSALLKAAGIKSYYCVVNSGSFRRDADPDFASVNEGDHVILAIPGRKDTVWLECTSKKMPFGFLGDFTDDRVVVACTEEGGKLLRTPKYISGDNLQYRKAEFSLTDQGDLEGEIITDFRGCQYDNHLVLEELPDMDAKRKLADFYSYPDLRVKEMSFSVANRNMSNPQAIEKLKIASAAYLVKNGNKCYMLLNQSNRLRMTLQRSGVRMNDIYVNRGFKDVDEYSYRLSRNYKPEYLPQSVAISNEFGRFNMTVIYADGLLKYSRELEIFDGTFPKERYEAMIEFYDKIMDTDQLKIVLNVGS